MLAKPASTTTWLAQRVVEDVVKAGILPNGTLSILCGSARNLLEHVREDDAISFAGSAQTLVSIRTQANVAARSVRVNVEADRLNSTILGPDAAP